MKFPHSPRGGRLITGMLALIGMIPQAFADDTSIPHGTLTVDRSLVRVGAQSQLGWSIQYPSAGITDIVDVIDNGTIIPKQNLKMSVRTLGVAFQSGNSLLPLEGYWSLNNSAWTRFFTGTGPTVVPTKVLVSQNVKQNDRIDFMGRGWNGSTWLPSHDTRSKDPYVIVLRSGDRAPSYAPAYNQGSVTSFLSPYIDGSGKIKIGDHDLIILWEASTAKPGTTYFDMQDLVVLVTFA